ncbi:hypothetical protein GCM10010168_27060 [Actinoplanes ianthinogenes]|uniref:Tail sheath protein n=1 Tax=Actinoplanes ianthinogenes TaxID=122358 RepID=A0ABN6C5M8_9ACTN|nr:phage tail sheath C-terminal domain-containing protein [Actinoplanes ianthinogenes]BCJ39846.1 hypothetical protein Aiant_05030 [Actinoplanes ianthinogenes]GGR08546.1 hypothetical protein GCM10010168_27060 [Actinoplanes ianthinogenes]
MAEYLSPGVYLEEADTGARPIEGVSVSVAGLAGVTERGPVNRPTQVISLADFTRRFGGTINRRAVPDPAGPAWVLPHAVEGFFTNGGSLLFVVRVLPDEATYSTVLLYATEDAGYSGAPVALARRGDRLLVVADPAGPAPGDVVRIEDDTRTEYVTAGTGTPIALTAPLTAAAPAGTTVVPKAAGKPPGTTLVHPAAAGDRLLVVQDATVLPAAKDVVLGTDPAQQLGRGALATAALSGPLTLRHDAGTPVEKHTVAAETTITAVGSGSLEVAAAAGLAADDWVHLAGAAGDEFAQVATVTAAAPFTITFTAPLRHAYAVNDKVQRLAGGGKPATLVRDGSPGDTALVLTGAVADGDLVRIGSAQRGEFADVVAGDTGLLVLAGPLTAAHAVAGVTLTAVTPVLRLQALHRGGWGDNVRVTAQREPSPTVDTTTPGGSATAPTVDLDTGVGLEPGSLLEFSDANGVLFRQKAESVQGTTVTLPAGGLTADVPAGTRVRTTEFALTVELVRTDPRTRRETIAPGGSQTLRNLVLDPRHSRWAPRVIGAIPALDQAGEGEADLVRMADPRPAAAARAALTPWPDLLTSVDPALGERPLGRRMSGGADHLEKLTDDILIGADSIEPAERTGLQALRNVEQISMVAAPGWTGARVQQALLTHCEQMRYRIAVLDSRRGGPPYGLRVDEVLTQRGNYDSRHGALYYPWLVIDDPYRDNPAVPSPVWIPPSGHVLGVYARTDVHLAPANATLTGVDGFQTRLVKAQQDLLNPRGVNALRDFRDQNRGLRVWGARCVTSDSDWKYVNVRRLFNFLEASIENGTQWAVFRPNDRPLWSQVRQSVSAFLTSVWRDGALQGRTPDEAFYVRCDETTMTGDDIDNGRLIVVIGVAPVKPAEFVVIRIGQWPGGSMVQEG